MEEPIERRRFSMREWVFPPVTPFDCFLDLAFRFSRFVISRQ
jgi:hypothetical protein